MVFEVESRRIKIFKDDFNYNREIELKEKVFKKINKIEELTVKKIRSEEFIFRD